MTDLPAWVAQYVGIPFVDHGRGRDGLDCWGLLCLVMREQFGVALPSYDESYQRTADSGVVAMAMRTHLPASPWRAIPVAEARCGDGLLLRVQGHPIHVGLVVAEDRFLHAHPRAGTVVDRLSAPSWQRRVLGAYRYTP